ncbi:MAG: gliding motility protein [Archangium sp.]|nr:gliding motility protein [Archangium sp.]
MAETWNQRWLREVREVHAAVDALLTRDPSGPALRTAIEEASKVRHFNHLSYKWAPWLWRKLAADRSQRVALRPFLLGHLDGSALDPKGRFVQPWSEGKALDKWLAEVDAANDVELFRQVIQWKLRDSWKDFARRWRELLLQRVKAAATTTERQDALARFDFPAELDEPTALILFETYGSTARRFILDRLPWRGAFWEKLHGLAIRKRDEDTAWQLYRRQVDPPRWAKDVRSLITTISDGETLVAELEKRHPQVVSDAGPVFLELAQKKGVAALPYLQRHVRAVFPRWGWFGRTEGKSLVDLVKLADERAWTSLWAKLLQSSATPELWNSEVKRLLQLGASTMTVQHKLQLLTGAGGEWNFSGFGLAQVQPLSDEVACLMYERAPALLRGPFRMHLTHAQGTPKLIARVLTADDELLVDYFASRALIDFRVIGETVDKLTAHYEAMSLTDGSFVRRATHALSMMPAFTIWNYEHLLTTNKLARLLFERSTPLYLSDAKLVRELLESPQIHVQALGFRVLGTRDPRAVAMAAQQTDVLAPTLLRPLHRRTRLMAFAAIDNACQAEPAASALLDKMKQALALPDRRYPKEELVGLIGRVLSRWPKLRGKNEQPQLFRRELA